MEAGLQPGKPIPFRSGKKCKENVEIVLKQIKRNINVALCLYSVSKKEKKTEIQY